MTSPTDFAVTELQRSESVELSEPTAAHPSRNPHAPGKRKARPHARRKSKARANSPGKHQPTESTPAGRSARELPTKIRAAMPPLRAAIMAANDMRSDDPRYPDAKALEKRLYAEFTALCDELQETPVTSFDDLLVRAEIAQFEVRDWPLPYDPFPMLSEESVEGTQGDLEMRRLAAAVLSLAQRPLAIPPAGQATEISALVREHAAAEDAYSRCEELSGKARWWKEEHARQPYQGGEEQWLEIDTVEEKLERLKGECCERSDLIEELLSFAQPQCLEDLLPLAASAHRVIHDLVQNGKDLEQRELNKQQRRLLRLSAAVIMGLQRYSHGKAASLLSLLEDSWPPTECWPAELAATFAMADALKLDAISPTHTTRPITEQ